MKRIMTLIRPIGVLLSFGKVRGGFGVMSLLFLALLSVFACSSRHDAMVERLVALQKFNQADSVFTSDSAALELANYFDAHGDANERMLAHYLLGRAYYDMGEMPLALHHYHEAIESADTTDNDCDFRQLGRIHGQTAWLLLKQNALRHAMMEMNKASYYGKRCNDTLTIIASYDHLGSAYEKLNLLDSALIVAKRCSELYSRMGRRDLSACTEMAVADIYIRRGDLSTAAAIIRRYEGESGMFDSCHHVKKGKEIFYYTKGLYYLKAGLTDSATNSFRLLLENSIRINDKECAFEGLSQAYLSQGKKDSALHYSMLAYAYNDSCHREKNTENYQRAQEQYDYSRHQQAAAKASERARRLTWATACLCGALLLVLWAGVWLYRRVKASQRRRMADENRRYNDLLDRLAESEQTILRLEANASEQGEADQSMNDELEKERLVSAGLREELSVYEEDGNVQWSLKESLIDTPAVVRLHELACHGKAASDRAKGMLRKVVEDRQPSFYAHVMSPARKLTELEQMVSILIRLQFARSEISTLLDKSPQQVTNICSSINEKLFGRKGTKQLDSSLRQL